jgi:acyl-CoA synthetase (NDP forming)
MADVTPAGDASPFGQTDYRVLDRLVRPRTVAIIGASSDPSRTAGRPFKYLQMHGFRGTTYLINPRATSIDGLPCYPSIDALPTTPDVGLILVGPERVLDAVHELAALGTPTAIVLAGGYAEVGGEGIERQQALREAAGSMRLLGPNTIGIVNVVDGTVLTPSIALEITPLTPGRVGLVSQSGGLLGSILSRAEAKGVGFSRLIATGNEADIEAAEAVDYLLDDDATEVIALYIEGLRNPARFRAAARRAASLGKPIVVFKIGRSEAGARSASSHTGAMAGADRVYDAMFEQHGVIRAATYADLIDVPAALTSKRRPAGRRMGILTSTGGAGVLVSDACGMVGFEAPPPDEATVARLSTVLVGEASVPDRNPIDVTLAGLSSDIFRAAIGALLDSPTYDVVGVIVGSSGLSQPELAAGPVLEAVERSDKPVFVYVSPSAPNIVQYLNRRGVPAFDTPEGCAAALAALAKETGDRRQETGESSPPSPATPSTGLEVHGAPVSPRPLGCAGSPCHRKRGWGGEGLPGSGPLNEAEAKALFAQAGIPSVRERVASTPDQAAEIARELGGPVVVKVLSRDIVHKSDVGGVRVGVTPADVARVSAEILTAVGQSAPAARVDGLLVQEQVSGGVEVIVGFTRDPQLGPVVLVGAGGLATELYQDVVLRLPPIGHADARKMVERLRCYPLLTGFRGRPRADLAALTACIVAFSELVLELDDRLVEAEINPIFVLPEGRGVRAADAHVILR